MNVKELIELLQTCDPTALPTFVDSIVGPVEISSIQTPIPGIVFLE